MRAELQALARASPAEVRAEADAAIAEVSAAAPPEVQLELARPEVGQALVGYLAQVPGSIRRSLRRPRDPSGTTIPPGFNLKGPADLLALLPNQLPRLRSGMRLPGIPWELTELLGSGGFGEVWKGEHPTLKGISPVALKFCLDPEKGRDLRREADLVNRIMEQRRLPGIVPLRNAYTEADPVCLEYEFVGGGDLCGLLTDWRGLAPGKRAEKAARVVQTLAATVGHFHRLDPPIVHRDLKPSNVLLHREGKRVEVRVADFGIGDVAAHLGIARDRRGLSRGDLLGSTLRGSHTPFYASPEQVRGDKADPRDDVHALGVIWFQLLTGDVGRRPGTDYAEELQELDVPQGMVALLGQCTARPERRLPDGAALAERIRALLPGPKHRRPRRGCAITDREWLDSQPASLLALHHLREAGWKDYPPEATPLLKLLVAQLNTLGPEDVPVSPRNRLWELKERADLLAWEENQVVAGLMLVGNYEQLLEDLKGVPKGKHRPVLKEHLDYLHQVMLKQESPEDVVEVLKENLYGSLQLVYPDFGAP
jgi:serine/threonine protein kinase